MIQQRRCIVDGQAYEVLLSDDTQALFAAYEAKRAVIGIINSSIEGQSLKPALYAVESIDCVDDSLLEKAVRRRFGLPFFICETERLLIREFVTQDIPFVKKEPFDSWDDQLFYTKSRLESYMDHQYVFYEYGIWAVLEKESNRLVGKVGFTTFEQDFSGLELGYHIFCEDQGNGYGYEAAKAVVDYGTDELQAKIYMKIDPLNQRSIALAKKLGFFLITEKYSESEKCYSQYWSYGESLLEQDPLSPY